MLSEGQFGDYRMSHQPDIGETAVGIHEADKLYPDLHEHPEYYLNPDERRPNVQTRMALARVRGKPDAMLTIHRAAPPGAGFEAGNWVTPSKEYARQHARHPTDPAKDHPVISMAVPAHEVVEGSGNSVHEWGWRPRAK